jgi:hypothetical protein
LFMTACCDYQSQGKPSKRPASNRLERSQRYSRHLMLL